MSAAVSRRCKSHTISGVALLDDAWLESINSSLSPELPSVKVNEDFLFCRRIGLAACVLRSVDELTRQPALSGCFRGIQPHNLSTALLQFEFYMTDPSWRSLDFPL